jgi:broad specificity phosphatase PhoE
MKLFLVRHGITDAHEIGYRQTPESSLSAQGQKQAEAVGRRLASESIDQIFSSPWKRARQTAEAIGKAIGKKVEILEDLHERKHDPKLNGIAQNCDLAKQYLEELAKNYYDLDWAFLESETIRSATQRAIKVKNSLLSQYPDSNIVLVTHGIYLQCFVPACLLGDDYHSESFAKSFHCFSFANASLSVLEYKADRQLWSLKLLNATDHLS